MTAPAELDLPDVDDDAKVERPWVAIVWDDPINTMDYVTYVLMQLFDYPRATAHRLMLDVHHRGRAVVSTGTREQMELDVARLHTKGLSATLQQD